MPKWILVGILIVGLIYLNRIYAHYYNFIRDHEIMPVKISQKVNFPSQNSNQTVNYVAVGDSLTYGVGVESEEQTFPYLVSQKLSNKSQVELYNLGLPGATTDEVIKLELPKLATLKPDLITVMIGTNDARSIETENAFEKNFQTILEQATLNPETKVVVLNIPPLSHSKNLFPPAKYLVDLRTRRFNSIIDSLVREKVKNSPNLVIIDLYGQTKDQFGSDDSYFSEDFFHPSAKGYKLWSEIISEAFN